MKRLQKVFQTLVSFACVYACMYHSTIEVLEIKIPCLLCLILHLAFLTSTCLNYKLILILVNIFIWIIFKFTLAIFLAIFLFPVHWLVRLGKLARPARLHLEIPLIVRRLSAFQVN